MRRLFQIVLFAFPITLILGGCSRSQNPVDHTGIKNISHEIGKVDTIRIDDEYLSGQYNAFLYDSCIVFADKMQYTLNFYNLADGSLSTRRLGYGKGPNELTSMLYAQPLQGEGKEIVIIDSSQGLFVYSPENDSLIYKGIIDFNWGKGNRNDYDEISNYMLMEMSDFAISFAERDSSILMPLSLIRRNFDKTDKRMYENGHIFSYLNPNSMKASKPFGKFPELYLSNPMPFFEFFDFTVDYETNSIAYSFAPDSLIYISDASGTPIKTIGFEPAGINRDYTIGYDADQESFKNDIQNVGVNTGLYFDAENKLLFRTTLHNFPSGNVTIQAYDSEGNLILESPMPAYFKLLGRNDGNYYGTRFIPIEEGEKLIYPIYRFKIIPRLKR
ncbi:MAG: hypothetical protein NC336_07590 [Clostridium sp.]|nr:hypothetical protein [Clostridium sp.]